MRIAVVLVPLAAGRTLGRCDEAAIATACSLAAAAPGSHILALAVGDEAADQALGRALDLGAHSAVRVALDGLLAPDPRCLAFVLATAVRRQAFDLVLAGDGSEEASPGPMGPAIAEWLGLAHLTAVDDARLLAEAPAAILATRRDSGMVRALRVPLPALVAVGSHRASVPAGPSGAERPAAQIVRLADLGISPEDLGPSGDVPTSPEPGRPGVVLAADPEGLAQRLRDDGLVGHGR